MNDKKTFYDEWEITGEARAEEITGRRTAAKEKTEKYYRSTLSLGKKGRVTVTYRETESAKKELKKAAFEIFDDGARVYGYSELVFS